jgi:hypothetical protein
VEKSDKSEGGKRFKVIVVMDCETKDDFTIADVFENAPGFIEYAVCGDATAPDGSYRFSNVSLYTDIRDFDIDRKEGLDHFASEVAELW